MRTLLSVVAALGLLLANGPARARGQGQAKEQESPARTEAGEGDAESLIRRAIQMRGRGDDEGAYRLLRRAYDLSPSPRAAGQLGTCEQAIGRWVDAETHLIEALRAADDPWIKKNNDVLIRSLALVKSKVARVEVTGEPAGATVLVNGAPVGTLPLEGPVRVAAGEVEVELRAAGNGRAVKSFRLEGGQMQAVSLRVEPNTPARPAADTGPGAGSDPAPQPQPQPLPASPDSGGARWRRPLMLGSAALAVGMLGLGVYGAVRNNQLVDEFDSGCGLDASGKPIAAPDAPPSFTDSSCASLKNRYQSATTLALVGFVAAGVLAVGSLVLWLTEPSRPDGQTAAAWTCVPGVQPGAPASLGCAFRF